MSMLDDAAPGGRGRPLSGEPPSHMGSRSAALIERRGAGRGAGPCQPGHGDGIRSHGEANHRGRLSGKVDGNYQTEAKKGEQP